MRVLLCKSNTKQFNGAMIPYVFRWIFRSSSSFNGGYSRVMCVRFFFFHFGFENCLLTMTNRIGLAFYDQFILTTKRTLIRCKSKSFGSEQFFFLSSTFCHEFCWFRERWNANAALDMSPFLCVCVCVLPSCTHDEYGIFSHAFLLSPIIFYCPLYRLAHF